jgi:hypothetical protein
MSFHVGHSTPVSSISFLRRDTTWSVWANSNGIADTIRTHLARKHSKEWRKIVVIEKLKGWDKIRCDSENGDRPTREQFTWEGFLERLRRWIAVDDQVSPSLFLFLNISQMDLPQVYKCH